LEYTDVLVTRMMEAVCTSEMSVYSNDTTRSCIPKALIFELLEI